MALADKLLPYVNLKFDPYVDDDLRIDPDDFRIDPDYGCPHALTNAAPAVVRQWRKFVPRLRIRGRIRCKFEVHENRVAGPWPYYLHCSGLVEDRDTSALTTIVSITPLPTMSLPESAMTAFALNLAARLYNHELREQFEFDGKRVFDPHRDDPLDARPPVDHNNLELP